ncbi:hypothetical protein B0A48_05320 [Cryoendolithus antarcticus]|uniref:Uncharacterized protein n=1 Tax=Cryoendolithus antarcticus TaxID=1507870 RepID=A0A1V8TI56_9PEZI|nr:hypothetical protein B0A48_05320 [Cryoendolithus antarcticus]
MFRRSRPPPFDATSSPTTSSPSRATPPVSPLQFDFGLDANSLHSPVSARGDSERFGGVPFRPSTSDGARRSVVSLQPPVLPPIPRLSSRDELFGEFSTTAHAAREAEVSESGSANAAALQSNARMNAAQPSVRVESLPPAITRSVPSITGPPPRIETQTAQYGQPTPSDNVLDIDFDRPQMQASMFPQRAPVAPAGNAFAAHHSAMSREFIDSRDRPYSQPPAPRVPLLQQIHSSPNLLAAKSPVGASSQSASTGRSPLSPRSFTTNSSHLSPQSANGPNVLRKANSPTTTSYSGSRARPSTHSSTSTATSPLAQSTIGVMVPTHHTGGKSQDKKKADKRKTTLLNPMALLARRRSGQDEPPAVDPREMREHEQAQARQKSVVSGGLHKLPEDFDPRIKGKIVHDFNAPRPRRVFSQSDADLPSQSRGPQLGSRAPSIPAISGIPSLHTPIMGQSRDDVERPVLQHLDEDLNNHDRYSSIQAERLENKEFLYRVSQVSSHHPSMSQESAVLPPFARRSQQMDAAQASFYRDDESKRSSDPSSTGPISGKERNSASSSVGVVSPVITGALPPQTRESLSPISPQSAGQRVLSGSSYTRPISETLDQAASPTSTDRTSRHLSSLMSQSVTESSRHTSSSVSAQHASVNMSPTSLSMRPEPLSPRMPPPGTLVLQPRTANLIASPVSSPGGYVSSISSTPEPAELRSAVAMTQSRSPPKLVEKRASAVGHSKRSPTDDDMKHMPSTGSRFSFQLDGSEREEALLEEKHRRIVSSSSGPTTQADHDDEDYFDENAMEDEDEMEVQMRSQHASLDVMPPNGLAAPPNGGLQSLAHAREQLRPDQSEDGSIYGDSIPSIRHSHDLSYAEHPAFRAHSALATSRPTSAQPSYHRASGVDEYMSSAWQRGHGRGFSDASVITVGGNGQGRGDFVEDDFSHEESIPGGHGGAKPRSGFYLQPKAAGYSPSQSPVEGRKPSLPRLTTDEVNHGGKSIEQGQSPVPQSRNGDRSAGGFSAFDFTQGPDLSLDGSRPTSRQLASTNNGTAYAHDSKVLPSSHVGWNNGPPSPTVRAPSWSKTESFAHNSASATAREQSVPYAERLDPSSRAYNAATNHDTQYAADEDGQDDMYFDDGNFDASDLRSNKSVNSRPAIDEDDFDQPGFAGGYRGLPVRATNGAQYKPAERVVSMGGMSGDGPYPSFAASNPARVLDRDSRLLLTDLPLAAAPVEPRWIPQRNPSEDAKRLGMSTKVPPLPPQPGSGAGEVERTKTKLQAYHQALADAANKAAGDGRFIRMPSTSTAQSVSTQASADHLREMPQQQHAEGDQMGNARDDGSMYSQNETEHDHGDAPVQQLSPPPAQHNGFLAPSQEVDHSRTPSQRTTGSRYDTGVSYSPPKMAFDFGFDSTNSPRNGLSDDYATDDYADDFDDDDVIAAANAEALASDQDNFYGSEFGFYSRPARANSGSSKNKDQSQQQQPEAMNGGFFGTDGDDGTARDRYQAEPNLTPITERSEFSTRNSFIGLGGVAGGQHFGPPRTSHLPVSSLVETDPEAFETLRRLKANAFAGAGGSRASGSSIAGSNSSSLRNSQASLGRTSQGFSPASATAPPNGQGYFGTWLATGDSPTSPSVRGHSRDNSWGQGGQRQMPVQSQGEVQHAASPVAARKVAAGGERMGWI